MTKSRDSEQVGDGKSPSLKSQEVALRSSVDQASTLVAESCSALQIRSASAGLAAAAKQATLAPPPTSCQQRPWLSFFFDGTGNNLDADVGTLKHSNGAKLYRVHAEDNVVTGVYRIYVPGVGTYFDEVDDDGGGTLGLGSGRLGMRAWIGP